MSSSVIADGAVRLILALDDGEERAEASRILGAQCPLWTLSFPEDIAGVERLYSSDAADAIVTDFGFHAGALADWLTLWPLPSVLIVGAADEPARIEKTTRDEASLFLRRSADRSHLSLLPVLVRKALNIRESVSRQNAQIQMSERQYMNLVQAIPDIVYTLDADGRFLYLNEAVRELGFAPSALIGKHFSEIVHPDDVPRVSRSVVLPPLSGRATGDEGAPKLFDERRSGSRMTKNLEIKLRKAGAEGDYAMTSINSYGEVSCSGFRLPEYEGARLGTMGIIRDVTLRKQHERELESEIAAKEVLLKEIHHRVKNNLQVVSSLLNLQEGSITDPAARKVFTDCQSQIQSMSMVHEALYNSGTFERVDVQLYFERLVEYLSNLYEGSARDIGWDVAARGISLDIARAIPVALIVNELVSNIFKHAFPEGRKGAFRVSATAGEGGFRVEVEDDGVGLAAAEGRRGVGTDLVAALAAQVRGEASFSVGGSGSGTLVSVAFPS